MFSAVLQWFPQARDKPVNESPSREVSGEKEEKSKEKCVQEEASQSQCLAQPGSDGKAATPDNVGHQNTTNTNTERTASKSREDPLEREQKNSIAIDRLSQCYEGAISAFRQVAQSHSEIDEIRTRVRSHRTRHASLQEAFGKSKAKFMQNATEFGISPSAMAVWQEALAESHRTMAMESEALEAQAKMQRLAETELENAESEVGRMIEDLMKDLMRFMVAGRDAGLTGNFNPLDVLMDTETRSTLSAHSEVHPALLEYFDAAGDVALIGEELADLDYQYREEESMRLFLEDQGDELSMSDQKHEEEYLFRRADVVRRLDAAMAEAAIRRRRCEDEGIDIDGLENNVEGSGSDASIVPLRVRDLEDDDDTPRAKPQPIKGILRIADSAGENKLLKMLDGGSGKSPGSSPATPQSKLRQFIDRWKTGVPPGSPNSKSDSTWPQDAEIADSGKIIT